MPCGGLYFCAVLKKLTHILLLVLIGFSAQAQNTLGAKKIISGIVTDSAFGKPLAGISVQNITTKSGTKTNYRGTFSIEVGEDHYLKFTYTGYKPRIVRIRDLEDIDILKVTMAIGRVELKAVKITKPLTPYQKDSVERASIYKDVFEYKQEKSAMSPVTTVFQLFSKKHRNMRNFKEQVLKNEKQKFIDTRYTPEMVEDITKLKGDSLAIFMNSYPMEIDFARTASELEIRMWVRYNWADYQKNNELTKE